MPTIVFFITLAVTLAVLLTLKVLKPWLRTEKSSKHNQLIVLNIEVFKERIAEIKQDYEAGIISESAFRAQKTELERQLLLANEDNTAQPQLKVEDDSEAIESHDDNKSKVDASDKHSLNKNPAVNNALNKPSRRSRLILLIWIPFLIVLGYFLASDIKPTAYLWETHDKLGQVADDLLTGAIEVPPEWAAEDNIALFAALQMNVHRHAYDAERWMRLADIFMAFEAQEPAFEAMSRAYRLAPDDDAVAIRFAQIQFFSHGGQLNAEGSNALNRVLSHDPSHQGAQMLMIMGAVQSGDFDTAQQWIDQLRGNIVNSSAGDRSAALGSLDELSAMVEAQKLEALQATSEDGINNLTDNQLNDNDSIDSNSNNDNVAANVAITVTVNPSVLPLIEGDDILFVTVRAVAGGPPLAAKRLPMQDIISRLSGSQQLTTQGVAVELGDNDAMMRDRTISAALSADTPLLVTARISKSGQAITETGDLSAVPVPISNINEPIRVEINAQVP